MVTNKKHIKFSVSIIIVHYHVKKQLYASLESIMRSKPKSRYEIIVVNNDDDKKLGKDLLEQFQKVHYVANKNNGFGEGNNVGAKKAKGEFLFFLNPDTQIFSDTIDSLVRFFKEHKDAGIVAPLLLGKDGKPYQQGTLALDPLRAIFSLSFLNKLFPRNPIAKKYWLQDWDRKTSKEVAVAPGTAFMIRKDLFTQVGGFDKNFFLFFEEFDLCKRIKQLGWKIYITPTAKVFHEWGASTKQRKDIQSIFEKSRFYYFRKHFGLISAVLTEGFLRIGKYTLLLGSILALGAFLRFHNIDRTMMFIGDQGWFYLSARDMLLTGNIPLVGIASSHPWLHQGAFWTYLLGIGFGVLGFSPLTGAYLSGGLGIIGVIGTYWVGKQMFSRRVGLIAAALFATSPWVVLSDRTPYHTSPIPLFTVLFIYFLYKWVRGKPNYVPYVIGTLAILYNFELATALLGILTVLIWLYGYLAKYQWATEALRKKYIGVNIISFIVPMLPMLLHDLSHGFPQTFGFLAWLGYRGLIFFGFPPLNPVVPTAWSEMFFFFGEFLKKLLFIYDGPVALSIIMLSLGYVLLSLRRHIFKDSISRNILGMNILGVVNCVLLVGFFAARTPSDAYLPMLIPGLVLIVALGFDRLFVFSSLRVPAILFLVIIVVANVSYVVTKNYSFYNGAGSLEQRLKIAKNIVTESQGKEYNLKGSGQGSEFESFTMNYEYLAWWLGKEPAETEQPLKFIISEDHNGIQVKKK